MAEITKENIEVKGPSAPDVTQVEDAHESVEQYHHAMSGTGHFETSENIVRKSNKDQEEFEKREEKILRYIAQKEFQLALKEMIADFEERMAEFSRLEKQCTKDFEQFKDQMALENMELRDLEAELEEKIKFHESEIEELKDLQSLHEVGSEEHERYQREIERHQQAITDFGESKQLIIDQIEDNQTSLDTAAQSLKDMRQEITNAYAELNRMREMENVSEEELKAQQQKIDSLKNKLQGMNDDFKKAIESSENTNDGASQNLIEQVKQQMDATDKFTQMTADNTITIEEFRGFTTSTLLTGADDNALEAKNILNSGLKLTSDSGVGEATGQSAQAEMTLDACRQAIANSATKLVQSEQALADANGNPAPELIMAHRELILQHNEKVLELRNYEEENMVCVIPPEYPFIQNAIDQSAESTALKAAQINFESTLKDNNTITFNDGYSDYIVAEHEGEYYLIDDDGKYKVSEMLDEELQARVTASIEEQLNDGKQPANQAVFDSLEELSNAQIALNEYKQYIDDKYSVYTSNELIDPDTLEPIPYNPVFGESNQEMYASTEEAENNTNNQKYTTAAPSGMMG